MKKLILTLSTLSIAVWAWAQEVIPTDTDIFKLLGDVLSGAKGGHWLVAAGSLLTLLLTVLKNGNRIPIVAKLNIPKYLDKIPAAHFAIIVASLTGLGGLVSGLLGDHSLLWSVISGVEIGVASAGTHEVTKGIQRWLKLLPKPKK